MTTLFETPARPAVQPGDTVSWQDGQDRCESRVTATDDAGIATIQGRVAWDAPGLEVVARAAAGSMPRGIMPGRLAEIHVDLIRPNPLNPRTISDADVTALADDIRQNGLINPITVRRDGPAYEIISGERRFRACRVAGLTHVLVIDRGEISAEEAYRETIRENAQRADLTCLEEARAIEQMIGWGWDQTEIGQLLGGKSQAWVSRTQGLLRLPGQVQDLLRTGHLSRSHGEELLALSRWPQELLRWAEEAYQGGWSSARLADTVRQRREALEARERLPLDEPKPAGPSPAPVEAPKPEPAPVASAPPVAATPPEPAVSEAAPAGTPPEPAPVPTPTTAPQPEPPAAAPAAPVVKWMTCLLPEADYDWLTGRLLTVTDAVDHARRLHTIAERRGIGAGTLLEELEGEA